MGLKIVEGEPPKVAETAEVKTESMEGVLYYDAERRTESAGEKDAEAGDGED